MKKKILVIAPHPDDETLGCGGTILKHIKNKDEVNWMIVTKMDEKKVDKKIIKKRMNEIDKVRKAYGFKNVLNLEFNTATLDNIPKNKLVEKFKKNIQKLKPEIIYLPFKYDAHSDHKCTYDAVHSCTKSFRAPYVKSVRVYETLSETDFANNFNQMQFVPNLWIDITKQIEKKLKIMKIYNSELKKHPFPRSIKNLKALATHRGAFAGCKYAEAFYIVKEFN